ncbi:DegT/DnrJ/EryC1/StrS family aminotransferase [Candidatus Kaiserbacteria bacterium]|nr:DegT/DnrJ/EryC1/StrS family aminotransferase [Candidatus Kaiserbacteria bacterium]
MKKIQDRPVFLGGTPVLAKPLPPIHVVDREEIAAITRVINRGPLSGFAGVHSERFFGGEEVRAFEAEFSKKFKVKHAVSFNSATTALHGAIVALGIGPGDEVIVPPYTMSASATAVLMNGAIPIFADIDERTFCIDPKSVEKRITKYTKAVMAVNLLGQGADFAALLPLAKKHKLAIIEDNAQSPGATWRGKPLGTVGDIGVFSLNVHKAIQTGEGGILVTNNPIYALRAQLCRNHGEAVVDDMTDYDAGPIFGSNYRMTEVVAAMARVQLRRLDFLTKKRVALAARLTKALAQIPGLTPPFVHSGNTHVIHRYAIRVDEKKLGISRDRLVEAMAAEGFSMSRGYVKPIYLLKLFQERKAFNRTGFPFEKNTYYKGNPDYSKGLCPVTERMFEKEFTFTDVCQYPYTARHTDLFVAALKKIIAYKHELA